eukprot:m.300063 g.300063  ORF g.300063 m.300063 type:complete len:68 (+) comp16418_c2_seq36:172-375(+)
MDAYMLLSPYKQVKMDTLTVNPTVQGVFKSRWQFIRCTVQGPEINGALKLLCAKWKCTVAHVHQPHG